MQVCNIHMWKIHFLGKIDVYKMQVWLYEYVCFHVCMCVREKTELWLLRRFILQVTVIVYHLKNKHFGPSHFISEGKSFE